MKILVATDNYPPRYDGISRFLIEVLPALNTKHHVEVMAPDFGPTSQEWSVNKIPTHKFSMGDFHPAKTEWIKAFKLVKNSDIVFLQSLGTIGLPCWLAAVIQRKPMVIYTHSIEWELVPKSTERLWVKKYAPGLLKAFDKFVYNRMSRILVPGSAVEDVYRYNKITGPFQNISLGVDSNKFKPPKSKKKAKAELKIKSDRLVIGYHGRLAREKDLITLLRAYKRLKAKRKDVELLVVGDGLREIRSKIEEHGGRVTGFVDDAEKYLQAMDIYVLPSLTETSSLSVMEAMSASLPVISTPVGYVKDYIHHGENGLLFSPQNSAELYHHLNKLCDDKKLRSQLGRQARKSITQKFSWKQTREAINKALEEVYQANN